MIIIVFKKDDLPLANYLNNITNCGTIQLKSNRGYVLWQISDIVGVYTVVNLINGNMRTPKLEALNRTIDWINEYIENNKNITIKNNNKNINKNKNKNSFVTQALLPHHNFELNLGNKDSLLASHSTAKTNLLKDKYIPMEKITKLNVLRKNMKHLQYWKLACRLLIKNFINWSLLKSSDAVELPLAFGSVRSAAQQRTEGMEQFKNSYLLTKTDKDRKKKEKFLLKLKKLNIFRFAIKYYNSSPAGILKPLDEIVKLDQQRRHQKSRNLKHNLPILSNNEIMDYLLAQDEKKKKKKKKNC